MEQCCANALARRWAYVIRGQPSPHLPLLLSSPLPSRFEKGPLNTVLEPGEHCKLARGLRHCLND